ncbi:MAG TPA: FMN-binding negative transcriptional regulator [Bacillota bacterium]|nr:FMN-binding negative transcriptional regulator [Bacillota bacterium]
MFASPSYPEPSAQEIDAFVSRQWCGKVIATDADGFPHVSILPFLKQGERIEIHMVQADPTFAALRAAGRGAFLLDQPLAFTPHHLVAERDAGMATLHFRAVLFRVIAEVSTEPADVAAALERLLAAYQGDAAWDPVVDGEAYGGRLRRLAVARLRVVGVEAKFKVAQNRAPAERARLLQYLRAAGQESAAAELQAAAPREG